MKIREEKAKKSIRCYRYETTNIKIFDQKCKVHEVQITLLWVNAITSLR